MIINIRPAGGYIFKNKNNTVNNPNQTSITINSDLFIKNQDSYSDKARFQNSAKASNQSEK